ncbi:MAG: FCD domain-containing protein [Pseudomonadota bacterium]
MARPSADDLGIAPLESEPAYKVLADKIMTQILAGAIPPGAMLPPELELAERFGVHRSTVREGIRLLEETGMLRRKSAKRLVVSVPDGTRLAERSVQALIMRRITVRSLYEANLALDPAMGRIAAERATDAQIDRLKRNLNDTMSAEAGDLQALDAEFHSLVTEATNNAIFPILRQPLQDLFIPMVAQLMRNVDTRDRMVEAHRRVIAAIEVRDPDEAELWMRRHIEDFKRGCQMAGLDFDAVVSIDGDLPS